MRHKNVSKYRQFPYPPKKNTAIFRTFSPCVVVSDSTATHKTYSPRLNQQNPYSMLSTLSENKNIGLLLGKHPYFRCKTSVLLPKEVRCFANPGPLYLSSPKKVFEKNLHFLHPYLKHPAFTGSFGCRIGCRIVFFGCRIVHFPYKTAQKKRQNRYGFLP